MSRKTDKPLDPRARHLLRALVAQYVRDGQPVGSRTLAQACGLDVSPATIRNVMADLEESGFLSAAHTSAGRIPTPRGYRLFVDSLLQLEPLGEADVESIRSQLPTAAGTSDLLASVSNMLSGITRFVGIVTVPRREHFAFRHIDFVALDATQVMVILVFTDQEVQNRIVQLARPLATGELEWIANYLNANFAGLTLDEIRRRLVRELDGDRARLDRMMAATVLLADAALRSENDTEVVMTGQNNLLGMQELSDIDRLRELFEAFARKQDLLRVLEGCIHADGVRLFIGEESGVASLDQCSVVATPYGAGGKVLGVLGVIGPTRMRYERVIPVVQATAQVLSQALNVAAPTP